MKKHYYQNNWFIGAVLMMAFIFMIGTFWPVTIIAAILTAIIMLVIDHFIEDGRLLLPLTILAYYLLCVLAITIIKKNKRLRKRFL